MARNDADDLVVTGRGARDFVVEIGSEDLDRPFRELLAEVQGSPGRRFDAGDLYWAVWLDILETTGTAPGSGGMTVRLVDGDFRVVKSED
ncbi:hypothetical protein [Frondihabitans australicus]|uniref:hypothetical protein n=1 Tax=Frondihabitans australicus TaxID=386892 RepID=UPI0011C35FC9|nr:hypothetical protein [Frondihabitans australicus]